MTNRIIRAGRAAKDKARRITGISFPLGGVQWRDPGPSEREHVRRFIVFLEDRRALYNPDDLEVESQVEHSVHQIREECTKLLQQLGEDAFGAVPVHAIRAACRRYHDDANLHFRFFDHRHHDHGMHDRRMRPGFFVALGALRAAVGQQLAHLSEHYGIVIRGELAEILPKGDEP